MDAAEDKNPYTVECLLGVVELDYDDSTRSFSMDTKQRESLLAKSRATSHAAASKPTDDAAGGAAQQNAERSAWAVTRAHRSRQPKRPHRNEAGALLYEADAHDNARARKEREGSAG